VIQVPVVSQPPVIFTTLIPIPGFLGSPHNLTEKLFDNASNKGSVSQVFSIDEKTVDADVVGQPQVSHPQLGQEVQQGTGVHATTVGYVSHGGVGEGVGVGVGEGTIIVLHLCSKHIQPQVSQGSKLHPQPQLTCLS
jgi:hypothetical protein